MNMIWCPAVALAAGDGGRLFSAGPPTGGAALGNGGVFLAAVDPAKGMP